LERDSTTALIYLETINQKTCIENKGMIKILSKIEAKENFPSV
jgi:hypothetical protein